jgi:hypothetical protein
VLLEYGQLGVDNNLGPLTVMLNQGNGTFAAPVRSGVVSIIGAIPMDFAMGDFRNTGQLDFVGLIYADTSTGGPALIYAKNTGNGTFGAAVNLPLPFSTMYAFGTVALGDFNDDGKLDLALASPGDNTASDVLAIYLGNGDGTFKAPVSTSFGNGILAQAAFVGDANGDGKPDIFVWLGSNGYIGTTLFEFLGNGDGTFQPGTVALSGVSEMSMVDLNHDGRLDVIDFESADSRGVPGEATVAVNVYLGQANGTFAKPVSYSPYSGNFYWTHGVGLSDNISKEFAPYLGDFDGDGNLDLAILQKDAAYGGPAYVQFMKGSGDGTFLPTFDIFTFGSSTPPELSAFNLYGDNRSSLVQTPAYTAGYQIIPAGPAPLFQIAMAATPVVTGQDSLIVSLNVASSSSTTVTLAASNANVSIPASATIPAGQISVSVPFAVGSSFPADHWFSITAVSGSTTAVAYNYPWTKQLLPPFSLEVAGGWAPRTIGNFSSPVPGEESDWTTTLDSNGNGSGTFQLSCSGLPSGSTCASFTPSSMDIEEGYGVNGTYVITTPASIAPGNYPYTVTATDASGSTSTAATLKVGDFSVSLAPASVNAASSGTANYTLGSTMDFGFDEVLIISCSGLPTGATCASQGQQVASASQPFAINLSGVAAGTYTFTVSASYGSTLTRSATAKLVVAGGPIAVIDATPISFSPLLVGATASAPAITLSNTGNATLTVTKIAATGTGSSAGEFAQTNTCGSSLAAGATCTITPTFSPTAAGGAIGTLTLTDNAADSPQTIQLSGTAVDFSIAVFPGSNTSSTVEPGQMAEYAMVAAASGVNGTINFSCSGAPQTAVCSVSPSSFAAPQGSQSIPVTVKVTTTASSAMLAPGASRNISGLRLAPIFAGVVLVLMCSAAALPFSRRGWGYGFGVLAILFAFVVLPGCGGGGKYSGGGPSGTPAGTYPLVVTAQSSVGNRTTTVTLIVQ